MMSCLLKQRLEKKLAVLLTLLMLPSIGISQSLDSVNFKKSPFTNCDSNKAFIYGKLPNSAYSVDSTTLTSRKPPRYTTYVSSAGIGSPVITTFEDSVKTAPVPLNADTLVVRLDDNGTLTDSIEKSISFQACSLKAGFNLTSDSVCLANAIPITDTSRSADSVAWYLGGQFATAGPPMFSVSQPGFSTIKQVVFDTSNSESDTATAQVFGKQRPSFQVTPDSICGNQPDTLAASQGFGTYNWTLNNNNVSGTNARLPVQQNGTYRVTAQASNGCTVEDSASVKARVQLRPDTNLCQGDTLVLDAGNPSSSYQWQDNTTQQTYTATRTDTFKVTVTANPGCQGTDSALLTFQSTPAVALGPDTAICPADNLVLDAGNPGAAYQWQDSSTQQTYTVRQSGRFRVKVTNANGCTDRDTIQVQTHSKPALTLGADRSFCDGDSIVLDAQVPQGQYQWQDGSQQPTYTAQDSGTYHVTVQGRNGCTNRDSVTLNETPLPEPTLRADTTLCPSASLTLDARIPAGDQYLWQGRISQPTVSADTAGAYRVQVTDTNSCAGRDSFVRKAFSKPSVSLPDTFYCEGASVVLDAGTADSYQWENGSTSRTVSINTPGKQKVTVTNQQGCEATDSALVTERPKPAVSLRPDTAICAGDSLVLDAGSAGSRYQWSTGSTTPQIKVATADRYTVAVTDQGCTTTDTIRLSINEPIAFSLGRDTTLCPSDSLTLSGPSGARAYRWSNGQTSDTLLVGDSLRQFPNPERFYLTVTDQNGCRSQDSLLVALANKPAFSLSPQDTTICSEDSGRLQVLASGQNYTYAWSDGSSGNTLRFGAAANDTTYAIGIRATNEEGCATADTARIFVEGCTGTSTVEGESLTLYPNPAEGQARLDWKPEQLRVRRVMVQTVGGQKVYETRHSAAPIMLPVNLWKPGSYLVTILTHQGWLQRKLVVE